MNVPTAWSSQVRHLAARIPCNPARLPVQAFLALCLEESMQRCLFDALHAAMCKMRHTLCRKCLSREPRRAAWHPGSDTYADAFKKACRDVFLMPYMLRCAMCGKCAAGNAWTGSLEGLRGTLAARRARMPSRKQWAASRNLGSLWRAASALQRPRHTSPGYSGPACHHRRCNSSPDIATSSPTVPPCKNPGTGEPRHRSWSSFWRAAPAPLRSGHPSPAL